MSKQVKKVIAAYGFEYDALISDSAPLILCKCFESQNPFYASPSYIIESTSVDFIQRHIKLFDDDEEGHKKRVDEMAKYRHLANDRPCTPEWRIVIYYDNITFDRIEIQYESEGDENGDGR